MRFPNLVAYRYKQSINLVVVRFILDSFKFAHKIKGKYPVVNGTKINVRGNYISLSAILPTIFFYKMNANF